MKSESEESKNYKIRQAISCSVIMLLLLILFMCLQTEVSLAAVSQQEGMYDTRYVNLTNSNCTNMYCHGASSSQRHHATYQGINADCSVCHDNNNGQIEVSSDCVSCHSNGPHHKSAFALNQQCSVCHSPDLVSSLVQDPGTFNPPSPVTPEKCRNCHAGDPGSFPPVAESRDLHKDTGLNCQTCHNTDLTTDIRLCEQCHLPPILHSIHKDNCGSCHSQASLSQLPPAELLPAINSLGAAWGMPGDTLTIMGDNLGEFPGTVKFGPGKAPVVKWQDNSVTITVPALAPGNYEISLVNAKGSSNIKVYTVLKGLKVVSASVYGMVDRLYYDLVTFDCRICHGSTADRHHLVPDAQCTNCHTYEGKNIKVERDCKLCHIDGAHHSGNSSQSGNCTMCHSSQIISDFNSEPKPDQNNVPVPSQSSCIKCHKTPAPKYTHHGLGLNCTWCHDFTEPVPIRSCESCHSVNRLHNVESHRQPANCIGCHSSQPNQFPGWLPSTQPELKTLSVNSGGAGLTLIIKGLNFGEAFDKGKVYFDNYNASVSEWTNTAITIQIPNLPAGNYPVSVQTPAGRSNSLDFAITNPGILAGKVTDSSSRPLAGAKIVVGTKTAYTDINGNYKVTGLQQGYYVVQASLIKYITVEQYGVYVLTGLETQCNFTLPLAAKTLAVSLKASNITFNRVDLSWQSTTSNSGIANYVVYRNGVKIATTNKTGYSDLTPAEKTSYTYYVNAVDSKNTILQVSNYAKLDTPACPDTQTPSTPSNLAVTNAVYNKVSLSWTASTDNVGVKGYDIYRNGLRISTTTQPGFSDNLVIEKNQYTYYVAAFDAAGNKSAASAKVTVTVPPPPDTIAPTAPSALSKSIVTPNRVDLTWSPSTDNIAVVNYGIYRNGTIIGNSVQTKFSDITVSPDNKYSYYIIAFDEAGNASPPSANLQVTTPVVPDTQSPTAPTGLTAVNGYVQINLSWQPSTDNKAVTGYEVYRSNDGITFTYVSTTGVTSLADAGVLRGKPYYYQVIAFDEAGNRSPASASTDMVCMPTLYDYQKPTTPANLGVKSVSSTRNDLSWTASTDNVLVAGYEIFRNDVKIGSTTHTSYSDSSVLPETNNAYYVVAFDADKNRSNYSNLVIVTSPTGSDSQKPNTPGNPARTILNANVAGFSWTPSTDNVGVAGYDVFRDGVCIDSAVSPVYTDYTVKAGTSYSYHVSAFDADRNYSSASPSLKLTTLDVADNKAPSVPANIVATAVYYNRVDITWTASTDNIGVDYYEIKRNYVDIGKTTEPKFSDSTVKELTNYMYQITAVDAAGNKSWHAIWVNTPIGTDIKSPTPATVSRTTLTTNQVGLAWSGSTDNFGVVGYDVYRDGVKISTVTGTGYIDNTVTMSKTYSYYVIAFDAAGNRSPASNTLTVATPAVADTQIPTSPWIGSVLQGANNTAMLWSASTDNVEVLGYEVYRSEDGVNYQCIGSLKTCGFADTNLQPGTNYWYYVVAYDSSKNYSKPSNKEILVPGSHTDITPPSVPSNLTIKAVAADQANLSWTASTDDMGVTGYYIYRNGIKIDATDQNWYWDKSLTKSASYSYYVVAFDVARRMSPASSSVSVTTLSDYDTQSPSIPSGFIGAAFSPHKIDLSWTASTDNIGVWGYEIYRNGTKIATTSQTNYSDTPVLEKRSYSYYLIAYDGAGNKSNATAAITVTTPDGPDITPPATPAGLSANALAHNYVNLSWTASTDNKGVAGYEIYRNGVKTGSATGTTYSDTTVKEKTSYSYYVIAYDAAGNKSQQSASVSITTPMGPDISPPSVPELKATGSYSSVALSWTASTDNVGVTGYKIFRSTDGTNFYLYSTASSTSITISGSAGLYYFYVVAYDAAGNESAPSITDIAALPVWYDYTKPSAPANLTAKAVSGNQVNISWEISTDNQAVIGYYICRNNTKIAAVTKNTYSDYTVEPGKTYTYHVVAFDGAKNCSDKSNSVTVTPASVSDTEQPAAPAGLSGIAVSPTQVDLTWQSSSDNIGVTRYEVFRNGKIVASANQNSYSDKTVAGYTNYTYYVIAVDAVGNMSLACNQVSLVTPAPPDFQSPTVPANLTANVISVNTVSLSWQASTDNIGVAGYDIYRNGVVIATVTGTAYQDNSCTEDNDYTYYVVAFDAAKNYSAASSAVSVKTY